MADTAEHIVVCDDEPDIRETVGEYLELQGYRVSAVDGGPALRELVENEKIDIVILDIMMPGEDGLSLARFLRERTNADAVMDAGVWRYSRHPNYFGEFCLWWGLYLLALAAGAWWTVIGPALLSLFLLRVSGVTMLEKDIAERRPAYREYIQKTSAFVPLPPRS